MRLQSTAFVVLGAALTFACGGGQPSPAPPTPAGAGTATPAQGTGPTTSAAPGAASPAATQPQGTATAPVGVAEIGIPECDSYVRKYEACVQRNAPASERARLQQALDQSRAAWRAAAAQPQAQGMLANMCREAETAARNSMSAYGCQW